MSISFKLYGIHSGRMTYKNSAAHNGSWYNKRGEKIGWGDLDYKDLYAITRKVPEGDAFIVLGEHDSYWPFVKFQTTHQDPTASVMAPRYDMNAVYVDPKVNAPGLEFIAEKARHVVHNGEIFTRTMIPSVDASTRYETREGINVVLLDEEQMKKLVLGL